MTAPNKPKVAVVGAGPMGLAVAYHLAKSNRFDIQVFEAGKDPGGMSVSFDFDGLQIERFYHFVCRADQPLFDLLQELDLNHKLHWQDTKMGYFYEGKLHEWGNPFALLKFPHVPFITRLRYGVMAFFATRRSDWQDLDKLDAVTWLKSWLGETGYERLWQRLFELKFYQYTPNLSAAWIWTRIKRVGTSRRHLLQESLGYLERGSATIIDGLCQALDERGVKIHLETPIEQIFLSRDGKAVDGIKTRRGRAEFDFVVTTIPLPYMSSMIPDLPAELHSKYLSLDNIAVVCVIIRLSKQLTPYFWLNIVDQQMDIPGLVEYSNLHTGAGHIVYLPYYVPGEHPLYSEPDQEFINKARRYLKRINPALQDADILNIEVSRYRHAQPVCPPEFLSRLPPVKLPVKGLYVADTSHYYPEDRSISESVRVGKLISEQILEEIN